MSQKSYDEKPALYLIPTPIGNMEDMTVRAIKTIENVDLLLTEDTRITGVLLNNLNLKKKMVINNDHNEDKNINLVIKYLNDGKNVGLVSDRGTPVISDPGFNVAKGVLEQGYKVIGLPGPTALIPALITSGLNPLPFVFYGFLNSKDSKRRQELENLKNIKYTLIFYEAPHRILKTLNLIYEVMGNRKISISREITKKFEEIYRGNVVDVINEIIEPKGEFVIVLEGNNEIYTADSISLNQQIDNLISSGLSKMDAIKKVAKLNNMSKNEIYNKYHTK